MEEYDISKEGCTMKRIDKKYLPWLNGLLSAVVMYLMIPLIARGVPDFIWIGLALLLPLIPGVWLLFMVDRLPPKSVWKDRKSVV